MYEHLDANLGKETAKKLTVFIGSEINEKFDHNMKTLATKEDLVKLAMSTKEDLAKLEIKIGETKVDIIRWIIYMWITIILMFIGLYFKS